LRIAWKVNIQDLPSDRDPIPSMKSILSAAIVVSMLAVGLQAQTAPAAAELTTLLRNFLDGASRNDAAMHDRFWADDLIYTGSSGRRIGKADIMRDVQSAPAPKPGDPATAYSAEDIRIQQYGSTAIVAFRLVGVTRREGKTETANYLNTGTFLKRNGRWQVVSWQATKMPRSEDDAKKEVAAAEGAFHLALLASDIKTLGALVDESFIWTHDDGQQVTRQLLLDQLGSGRLKYSRFETNGVTVSVDGDTGVVRGVSTRQRSSAPGGPPDANPFTAYYTVTFVNKGSGWKAVAIHSSRL
jgi:Domain of unknown function (DUF4440)